MSAVYPNPWDDYNGKIGIYFEAPLRLRLDKPYINEGNTILRCELPGVFGGESTPTLLWYYRRESTNRVDWGEWESFVFPMPKIDGSVTYEPGEVFTLGFNTETGLREARLRVTPPETLGNYFQYCVAISGSASSKLPYDLPVSEYTLSENCLRYGVVEFGPYTDATLAPGETRIKAVHMAEMQERVATIYDHFAYGEFVHTPTVAGATSLGLWLQQVNELRSAIDEHFPAHEDWLTVTINRPRADIMMQLRRVIDDVANGGSDPVEVVREQYCTANGGQLVTADGLYFKALEGTANG